jgi:polysaccharide export outer membrane protein
VYDHPDLTTETRVSEGGTILFPLIGQVSVGGLTAQAAAGRIAKGLESGGFIKSAQVNLVVLEFKGQEVSVLGYVNRPGKFPLQKRSRVIDVLALAGGVVPSGADTLVLIRNRDGKTERKEIDLIALFREGGEALNLEVANDDILNVAREPRFYIYGEVQRPGAYRLERGMSVVQALALGGGLTTRGTQKGMRVLRSTPEGGMQTLEVQLADRLMPDDVIFVRESLF